MGVAVDGRVSMKDYISADVAAFEKQLVGVLGMCRKVYGNEDFGLYRELEGEILNGFYYFVNAHRKIEIAVSFS